MSRDRIWEEMEKGIQPPMQEPSWHALTQECLKGGMEAWRDGGMEVPVLAVQGAEGGRMSLFSYLEDRALIWL